MSNSNSPHAPRPTGRDLAKRAYKVEDKDGKQFGADLTWDEAWKRKEEVAGQRKSTTPRIMLMVAGEGAGLSLAGKNGSKLKSKSNGYTEAQRQASVVRAARIAAAAADDTAAIVASGSPVALAAITDLSAIEREVFEATAVGAAADVAEVLADNGEPDDDDALDALIDEANEVAER